MTKSRIVKPSIGIYCAEKERSNIQPLIDFIEMLKWRKMAGKVFHPQQLMGEWEASREEREEEYRDHIEQVISSKLLVVAITMRLLASRFYRDRLREIIHKREEANFVAAHLSIHMKEHTGIDPLVPPKPIHDFSPQTKGWLEVNKAILAKVEAMNAGGS